MIYHYQNCNKILAYWGSQAQMVLADRKRQDEGQESRPNKPSSKAISKDDIIALLKRRIMLLDYAPGTPMDEASLVQEFGISRTPLRDILRQLAGEGYVQIHENRGAIVAPMDAKSMRHFFMTAPMIYAAISRLAAQIATASQIDKLSDIQRQFKQAVSDQSVESLVFLNDQFHFQIGEMADNAYLKPSLQRLLMEHARIGQTFWQSEAGIISKRIAEASLHHDQFVEIFAAHDEDAAVALTLSHWELSRKDMDDYIRPDPLREVIGLGL